MCGCDRLKAGKSRSFYPCGTIHNHSKYHYEPEWAHSTHCKLVSDIQGKCNQQWKEEIKTRLIKYADLGTTPCDPRRVVLEFGELLIKDINK